ncbi:MAG: hypothetical protein ACRCSN_04300, partial [Dermatophilaceae bacterium]
GGAAKASVRGAAATRFTRLLEAAGDTGLDIRTAAAAARLRLNTTLNTRLSGLATLSDDLTARLGGPHHATPGVPTSRTVLDNHVMRQAPHPPDRWSPSSRTGGDQPRDINPAGEQDGRNGDRQPERAEGLDQTKDIPEEGLLHGAVPDAANAATRSLDDIASLRGATTAEVESLIPSSWVKSATNAKAGGLGIRYSNPERLGEQIRIIPGKFTDPNPLKKGPYIRISRNGTVTEPIPLCGNPTL